MYDSTVVSVYLQIGMYVLLCLENLYTNEQTGEEEH